MTRSLIKPIVFLLIVGLVGCTTTKWAAFEPTESPTPIPHILVTFISGSQFEAYDAIVTRETISGTTKNEESFTVPMDEVRTLELYMGRELEIGGTATGMGVALLVVVVLLALSLSNACIGCPSYWPEPGVSN